MAKRFSIHEWQAKINEQSFDDRLKAAGGFSDEEMDDITSRDIGSPFPGEPLPPGTKKASDLIDKLRKEYRSMSDEDLDEFSAEMVEHFLDNTAAQARAKVFFARKGI